jgi:hypothetical protein
MDARLRVAELARQPTAATKNRLRAIASRALPHDMLNVHFDGVFRKIEPRRD